MDSPHIYCYGTYLHGLGSLLLNLYRLYLTLGEITSKQNGAYAVLSGRRWAGTHFGRPRFIGARIWSGVSWFQLQSADVRLDRHLPPSAGRLPRLWPSLEELGLSPGAWGTFFRRMPTGPKAFLQSPGESGLQPCGQIHIKKALCHTHPVSGMCDKYR